MKKRMLCAAMVTLMLLSAVFTASAAPLLVSTANPYSDLAGHWVGNDVSNLLQKKAIPFQQGKFLPGKAITRSEFALMLHRALDIQIAYFAAPDIKDYFDDVAADAPYASAVIDLVTAGILEGKGSFRPDDKLTREEMIHLVMQAYRYKMGDRYAPIKIGASSFPDADRISPAYSGDVSRAQHEGLIFGDRNNRFLPEKAATRAEAVAVISRLVALLEKQSAQVVVKPEALLSDNAIEMRIVIRNDSDNAVTIEHSSGQKFDFALLDVNRNVVYRWSADKLFMAMLTTTEIKAGETLVLSDILSGDAYTAIKDKIVWMQAFVTGTAPFLNADGYEIPLQ